MTWIQLLTVGIQWLPEAEFGRLESAIQRFTFPQGSVDDDGLRTFLGLTTAIPFLSAPTRELLEERAVDWAHKLRAIHGDRGLDLNAESTIGRDAKHLTETTVTLARRPTIEESFAALSSLVIRTVGAWPTMAQAWRPVLDRAFHALWSAYVTLRAES